MIHSAVSRESIEGTPPQAAVVSRITFRSVMDRAYVVLLYFFATGAIARIFGGQSADQPGANPIVSQGINAVIYLMTIGLAFHYLKPMWSLFTRSTWMFVLVAYFCVSFFWSSDHAGAFRYLRYVLVLFVAALYMVERHRAEYIVRTLVWCSLAMALLSIAGQFLLPPVDDLAPGWTGIFTTKNYLGSSMATGIAAVLALEGPWTILKFTTVALCGVLLVLSQSFTSVLCVLVTVAVLLFVAFGRRLKLVMLAGTLLLGIAVAAEPGLVGEALGFGGKTTDLTGRDKIWDFAWQGIEKHPILGYGASGYWLGDGDLSRWILGWNPNQAHNGYLEAMLRGGVICIVLLAIVLIESFPLAERVRRYQDPTAGRFLLFAVVTLLIHNTAESDFMMASGMWMAFLIAYYACRHLAYPSPDSPAPVEALV